MIAAAIFSVTLMGAALARLPFLKLVRPSAMFVGAVAMVQLGGDSFPEAINLVDWGTIALLLGMMVLTGVLQEDGQP